MADGLLDIIGPRLPLYCEYKRNEEYKWIKVYDMRDEGNCNIPLRDMKSNVIELFGYKLNKFNKKIDKKFCLLEAEEIIARNLK